MNKTELLSTYTAEQLAEMVAEKYNRLRSEEKPFGAHYDLGSAKAIRFIGFERAEADMLFEKFISKSSETIGNGFQNKSVLFPKEYEDIIKEILNIDPSEIKDDCHRFSIESLKRYLRTDFPKKIEELQIKKGNKEMNISKIQKCQEEYERILKESPLHRIIDGIAKDILEQKNNAMAMEFTRAICDLLKRYGVYVRCTETKHENVTHNLIEEKYGIIFDSVDFSQHDKEFTDKIEELKNQLDRSQNIINQIDEVLKELFGATFEICETKEDFDGYRKFLEKQIKEKTVTDFLPAEPIKVADMLISATYTRQKGDMEKALHKAFGNNSDTTIENVYSESELRQIAEHLLVYCNHNEGGKE